MRILFYNWTPINVSNLGGGVAIYNRNLMEYFLRLGHEIVSLDSGYKYDNNKNTYLKHNAEESPISSFSVVNSPVPAPMGVISYKMMEQILKDEECLKLFDDFIQRYGPFDVIHFQTLEGITPNVLSLKQKYSKTKFIHSFHDYGCFCMNARFWKNKVGENCVNNKGENCYACIKTSSVKSGKPYFLMRNGTKTVLPKFMHRIMWGMKYGYVKCFGSFHSERANKVFGAYRRYCVDNLNKYVDLELAVSKRVKEIVCKYGIIEDKVVVNYIGTKVAEKAINRCMSHFEGNFLTLLYMGYAKKAKGFYFFLDTLKKINCDLSRNMIVKIASRVSAKDRKNIEKLRSKFKDIIIYNGYSHDDFHEIFKGVNVGIVCPLWEDNLPQVAIEMVANGIPVITSSNGGAKELNTHPNFVFSNMEDLICKLEHIFRRPKILDEYWAYAIPLTSMKVHAAKLMTIYENDFLKDSLE